MGYLIFLTIWQTMVGNCAVALQLYPPGLLHGKIHKCRNREEMVLELKLVFLPAIKSPVRR